MAEVVAWGDDGIPRSPHFGDCYRPAPDGLARARHVFLAGCGLPAAWRGQPRWTLLETGFGLGLNFLAAWQAWRADPLRPQLLHFVSFEAWPVAADDIVRSAAAYPELQELARQLAQRWWGLLPGVHRLAFEGGQVLLTLAVGDAARHLKEHAFAADGVFLDGFDPERNPELWSLPTLKAVARLCRRETSLATWCVAAQVRSDLQACGFVIGKVPDLAPERHALRARFEPRWELRRRAATPPQPARCVVIGAGLAGAAAAASLAQRGWQVDVLDAAHEPAQGASSLPAGLMAPHQSPDDNLLSRLTRAGVRTTLQEAEARLWAGEDWAATGALERRGDDTRPPPPLGPALEPWSRSTEAGWWHAKAAWLQPRRLVRAWLGSSERIRFRGRSEVAALLREGDLWSVRDARQGELARAPLVVVAAALASGGLLPVTLGLHAVRGQISWNLHAAGEPLAKTPLNGHGHFLPDVPLPAGRAWLCGATYARGDADVAARAEDHAENLARLQVLAPPAAERLAAEFQRGEVRAWCGVRCASSDRRPLVGEIAPGLWVSTAMGSRGLTFAALCAELLAARLHAEPLPLDPRLADALDAARQLRRS